MIPLNVVVDVELDRVAVTVDGSRVEINHDPAEFRRQLDELNRASTRFLSAFVSPSDRRPEAAEDLGRQEQVIARRLAATLLPAPVLEGLRGTQGASGLVRWGWRSSEPAVHALPLELVGWPSASGDPCTVVPLGEAPGVAVSRLLPDQAAPFVASPSSAPVRWLQLVARGGMGASWNDEVVAAGARTQAALAEAAPGRVALRTAMAAQTVAPTHDVDVLTYHGHAGRGEDHVLFDFIHPDLCIDGVSFGPKDLFDAVGRPSSLLVLLCCQPDGGARLRPPSSGFLAEVPNVVRFRGALPSNLVFAFSAWLLAEVLNAGHIDLAVQRFRSAFRQLQRRVDLPGLRRMHPSSWVVQSWSTDALSLVAGAAGPVDTSDVNRFLSQVLVRLIDEAAR